MAIKARNLTKTLQTGIIQLPLPAWRITDAANTNVALVAATAVIGSGGVGGIDGEPKLIRVNVATDKALRLIWTASANDPLFNQFILPPDWDLTKDAYVRLLAASGGVADAPAFTIGTWPQGAVGALVTSVDVGGLSASIDAAGVAQVHTTLTSIQLYSRTLTAPSTAAQKLALAYPSTVNLEITPAAHTTDTAIVYGVWVEYTRK
jgi:hypothetical protein